MLLFTMLNRRTNILLNESEYQALDRRAKKFKKTKGQIVRELVRKYLMSEDDLNRTVISALDQLEKLNKKANTKGVSWKNLTHEGHKY